MKIATHNSEKILLADLREARIGNPTHRCLFLRLSKAVEPMDVWLPRLERGIRHILGDTVNQVYITHDRDVFIVGWGLTRTIVDELIAYLTDTLRPETMQGLHQLFEIGIHWDRLESLCTEKLRALEEAMRKDKERFKAGGTQNREDQAVKLSLGETMAQISGETVATIGKRRLERRSLEIMVVEDDVFSQTLIKKALGDHYKLTITGDGRGALLNYIKLAPDILFLDIELPDMNGHQVLEQIRYLDPEAYVVMFSGNGDRENILKAIDLGAQGFVGKPFTKDKLLQYIDKSPFAARRKKAAPPAS